MKTTKEAVIRAASDLADEKGLNNVSLKSVAEKLNIRTPSLYNHIESLDHLLLEVAHQGMRCMNDRMTQAAIGSIGETAIQKVAAAYLDYMIEHTEFMKRFNGFHGTVQKKQAPSFIIISYFYQPLFAPAHLKKKTQQIF